MRFSYSSLATLALSFLLLVNQAAMASHLVPAKKSAATVKPMSGPVAKSKTAVVAAAAAKAKAKAVVAPAAARMVTFTGVVLGQNGLALPGASVFPTGKFMSAVVTNEDGVFSLTMPAAQASTVNLTFAYAGLGDWQVKAKAGQRSPVLVTLLPKGM